MVGCKREGERGEKKGERERQKYKALFWKELHQGSARGWVWTQLKARVGLRRWLRG